MELIWKRLLGIMGTMIERCGVLAELARRQREAVIREQVRQVGEIVLAQEAELQTFQELEEERSALVAELGRQLGLAPALMTASRLLAVVPAAWSNEYRAQVERLRRLMEEVKTEHEVNRKLLRRSQEFVRWLLSFLVTPDGAAPVYDELGAQVQRSYYHFVNQML
jgi:hypothetical protein